MNITVEKTTSYHDKKSYSAEDFNETLEKYEEEFFNSLEKEKSDKIIEEYSINIFNKENYIPYFLPGNIFFFTITILFMVKTTLIDISTCFLFTLLLSSSMFFHCLILFKPIRKMLNKHWLKNKENKNSIKKKIFMNNVVDKDLLKKFSNVYGKKALKKLLEENESVKYKNIISYIRNHEDIEKEEKKKEERSTKIDEIIECITSPKS